MLEEKELNKICRYIHRLNNKEPLDRDDINDITNALKKFNGED